MKGVSFMDNPTFREKRSSGQHLDKKVNSIITAILNDMIVHADNSTDNKDAESRSAVIRARPYGLSRQDVQM